MENDRSAEIPKASPNIDPTAVERSRQAARQLADVGIKLGGYRLEPALGGKILKRGDQSGRRSACN